MATPARPHFISKDIRSGRYLFLNLITDSAARFEIACAGIETCTPTYHVERNAFPYFAIEYVTAGAGTFRADGQTHDLRAGSVITYGPGTPHAISATSDHLTKYFLDLSGAEAGQRLAQAMIPTGSHRMLGERRWVHDLFDQMIDCAEKPKGLAQELVPLLVDALLLRLRHNGDHRAGATSVSRQSFQRCRDFIRTHFRTLQRVEDVGRACAVSIPYLSRLFKDHAGESPYEYLTRLKMSYAADLVLHQAMKIKNVAAEVGFFDPYHFSRAFKNFHGASPVNFRRDFHRH